MMSSYLALAILSLSCSSVLSAEWLDCGPPKSFVVELENHQKTYVHDAEIKVKYDRNDLAVYDYPGLDDVNILINNSVVTFSGHVVPENEELNPDAFKMSRVFNTQIAGSAILMKLGHDADTLKDCNLYLSRNLNDEELNIPKKLQFDIIHEAANCVKSSLCQRLGIVKAADMTRAKNNPFNFGPLSVLFANMGSGKPLSTVSRIKAITNINEVKSLITDYNNAEENSVDRAELKSAINKLVDLAIAQLVKKIEEENQGKIKIPNLSQNFSTGSSWWESTGELNTYDGSFEDLTTLKRTEDATLSYKGQKFEAGCGFGLSVANLDYQRYKLRYGIINVNGKLAASVDGVAMAASIIVDYNQKPCRAELKELRVSELGKMKIRITGLGPLNKLLSKLVTWITKKWQVEIVEIVEEKLRGVIVDNLKKFNCEKFRP